jgi:hypothetical protein
MCPGSEGHWDAGGAPIVANDNGAGAVVTDIEGAAGISLGHELVGVMVETGDRYIGPELDGKVAAVVDHIGAVRGHVVGAGEIQGCVL